jgi:hypothetical protein
LRSQPTFLAHHTRHFPFLEGIFEFIVLIVPLFAGSLRKRCIFGHGRRRWQKSRVRPNVISFYFLHLLISSAIRSSQIPAAVARRLPHGIWPQQNYTHYISSRRSHEGPSTPEPFLQSSSQSSFIIHAPGIS